jgi:hypothetical protein
VLTPCRSSSRSCLHFRSLSTPFAFRLSASDDGLNPRAPRLLPPRDFRLRWTLKGRFTAAHRFGFIEPAPYRC